MKPSAGRAAPTSAAGESDGGAACAPGDVSRCSCTRSSPCWYFSSQYICESCSRRRAVLRALRHARTAAARAAMATNHRKVIASSHPCRFTGSQPASILGASMTERRKTLLIVDDDEGMRDTLTAMMRRDFRVLRSATGENALQMMEKEDVDLMLLDVRLPGISGFEVLKIARENYPYIEVIVISVIKELDAAIEAMRYGAYHYISKDFDLEGIKTLVANASERQDLSRHVLRLTAEVAEQNDREFVVGASP